MANQPNRLYEQATENKSNTFVLHARVNGASHEIALDVLGITGSASDQAIREAVARYLDLAPANLRNSVIERHDTGNITLRPEAIFG